MHLRLHLHQRAILCTHSSALLLALHTRRAHIARPHQCAFPRAHRERG